MRARISAATMTCEMAHPHNQIRPLPNQRMRDVVPMPGWRWTLPAIAARDAGRRDVEGIGAGDVREPGTMRGEG